MFKTNAHGPSPQPTGLQHAVLRPQQDVTRPKTRFKPTLHNKCGLDGGAIRWQHILVRYFSPNPVCTHIRLLFNIVDRQQSID